MEDVDFSFEWKGIEFTHPLIALEWEKFNYEHDHNKSTQQRVDGRVIQHEIKQCHSVAEAKRWSSRYKLLYRSDWDEVIMFDRISLIYRQQEANKNI